MRKSGAICEGRPRSLSARLTGGLSECYNDRIITGAFAKRFAPHGACKLRKLREKTTSGGNNRALLALICALAWPTVVEQALSTVVQYADSAMVGRIGAHASACVGLTTTMTWLVNSPMFAMGVGVMACVARAVGAKDFDRARRTASQSVLLALILGSVLGGVTLAISPFLPSWLGAEESLRHDGGLYFAIICAPMLFRASLILFASAMRATGDTRTPMFINIGVNVVNVILNFLLIYAARSVSLFGLTVTVPGAGMGVIGAAVATAIAYVMGGTAMFIAFWRNKAVSPRGRRIRLDKEVMTPCVRIGMPVLLEHMGSCLGQVVFSALVTSLGTVALATHSLAITAEQAFYIPGYGMQAAASTLAGQALGEQDEKKLNRVSLLITLMAAGIMTLTGAVLFAIPATMMGLFTTDAAVIAGGVTILRIVAVSEPIYGASIIFTGTFNGVGDTRTPFIISLLCMWGVRIVSTALCVKVFGLGLTAVWLCMVADNVTRGVLLGIRYVSGRWKKGLFEQKAA